MPEPTPPSLNNPVTRKRFIAIAMLALLGVFTYVVSSLLLGVVGGFILWGMSRGMYDKFLKWTRNRTNLAATLSVITLLLLVIAPVITVLSLMVNDAVDLTSQGIKFFNDLRPRVEAFGKQFLVR